VVVSGWSELGSFVSVYPFFNVGIFVKVCSFDLPGRFRFTELLSVRLSFFSFFFG